MIALHDDNLIDIISFADIKSLKSLLFVSQKIHSIVHETVTKYFDGCMMYPIYDNYLILYDNHVNHAFVSRYGLLKDVAHVDIEDAYIKNHRSTVWSKYGPRFVPYVKPKDSIAIKIIRMTMNDKSRKRLTLINDIIWTIDGPEIANIYEISYSDVINHWVMHGAFINYSTKEIIRVYGNTIRIYKYKTIEYDDIYTVDKIKIIDKYTNEPCVVTPVPESDNTVILGTNNKIYDTNTYAILGTYSILLEN